MSNFLDDLIAVFDPQRAYKRTAYRQAYNIRKNGRGWDATKGTSDGWTRVGLESGTSLSTALKTLRDRSRELVRNNAYAEKAMSVITNNVVGTGISASFTPIESGKRRKATGAKKETAEQGRADRLQAAFDDWAESTDCDADGVLDLYGLQALACRTVVQDGEVLIRRRLIDKKEAKRLGLTIPLQLQVLTADYICTSQDSTMGADSNGNRRIQGITFDSNNRRVSYCMFKRLPSDSHSLSQDTVEVPAEEIEHVYRVDNPGQVRGVAWAAPIMVRLKDFDEYEDAQLMRQKVAACFAAIITTNDLEDAGSNGLPKATGLETIEPGTFQFLKPGQEVSFPNVPSADNYAPYTASQLRAIASGFGVTYESLTGDYSQVNFSSARMGWLEFDRNVKAWQWRMMVPKMMRGVAKWFLFAADIAGNDSRGVRVLWTAPRREMIDPVKETEAQILQIRGGLTTLPETIRERGDDPDQILNEIAETNAKLDKLGLILDTDPRKVGLKNKDLPVVPEDPPQNVSSKDAKKK